MIVNYTLEQLNSLKAQGYGRAPLYISMLADLATPVQCLCKVKKRYGDCFLFESIEGGERIARYSFIGVKPAMYICLADGELTVKRGGELSKERVTDPNARIRELLGKCRQPEIEDLPPFTGGLVGYFSYEYYKYYENAHFLPSGRFGDCRLMLFDRVIAYDNFSHKIFVIANVDLGGQIQSAYSGALSDIADMANIIRGGGSQPSEGCGLISDFSMQFTRGQYMDNVERAKTFVREGDIFQCVPSNIWTAKLKGSLFPAYRILRTTNPSPYMIYFNMGEVEEGKDVLDALSAALPAGTLSGAPKRRAMEIISLLEEGKTRGVYGGAVGYISFDGDGDFCIAIRTAAKFKDVVTVRAGGGIVADSLPQSEFQETVNKSAAVREAIARSARGEL